MPSRPASLAPADQSTGFWRRVRALIVTALPSGAVILSILTFSGYAMGLVRDKMFAHTFGAGPELDAYNAAFVLPELALDVLVAGGIIAPFVPLFVGLRDKAQEDAHAFGRTILTLAVAVMAVAAALLFVFAPQSVAIIAPGFTGDQRNLYIGLFRVMCLTPVIFAASIVLGEILVAEKRFLLYGLAPLMYNGGIVAGVVLVSPLLPDGQQIYGAAIGAVCGAIAHLGIRVIGIYRTSFRPRPSLSLRVKGLGEFMRLMIPKMVSQPIEPLTFLYFTALASTLVPGSISSIAYARNFQGVPVSLIGASFSLAAFPALSAAAAHGDRSGFRRIFGTNLATIAVLTTAAAVAMLAVGGLFIRFILGGGAFDEQAISQTTLVLAVFTFSIPLESVAYLMARAIYATKNTIMPTIASLAGFTATVLCAGALAPEFGLAAIPAGYTIGMGVRLAILTLALAPRMARIGQPPAAVGPTGVDLRRRPGEVPRRAAAILAVVVLAGSSLAALSQTLPHVALGVDPVVTPWARQNAPESFSPPPLVADVSASPSPASSTPWIIAGTYAPSPTPSPTRNPGPFSMDLYEKGDFVGEYTDTWCVPAAMQTSMNIMDQGADTTRNTQARLYDLAASLGIHTYGGADPVGWAQGLEQLGYGKFEVRSGATIAEVVKVVAKQIRLTNRPAGLIVWRGWHSWVVSGFSATDDPAYTDNYTVTALRIEDVWYPRHSSIWGDSRPPDANVPVSALSKDYKIWHQGKIIASREGKFVYLVPVP